MYCMQCGAENADGQRFCTQCGARLEDGLFEGKLTEEEVMVPAVASPEPEEAASGPKLPKGMAKPLIAGLVVVLVLEALGLALYKGGVIGRVRGTATRETPQGDTVEHDVYEGVCIYDSVEQYSWEELSTISDMIDDCDSEDEALEIAKRFHLCKSDGTLDGTQRKSVEMTDGTVFEVQILGFLHDLKSHDDDKAGITFGACECVDISPVDVSGNNYGGWNESSLREYLNDDFYAMLPDDLRAEIWSVEKLTNNEGETRDTDSVTGTYDLVWLLSQAEVCGTVPGRDFPVGWEWIASVYNAEGSQYQLFSDCEIDWNGNNSILTMLFDTDAMKWWLRSPCPDMGDSYRAVTAGGMVHNSCEVDEGLGVVPCFCI